MENIRRTELLQLRTSWELQLIPRTHSEANKVGVNLGSRGSPDIITQVTFTLLMSKQNIGDVKVTDYDHS